MNWSVVFNWARNIFAVLGVLATALLVVAIGAAMSMESQYQRRAAEATQKAPVSLESANALMTEAGIARHDDDQLLGGINPPWSDGTRVEAYCVQARVDFSDTNWSSPAALDPYIARSAARVLDVAHDKLACIPDSQALRGIGWQLRVLGLELDASGIARSRIALRNPASAEYFLVDALRPEAKDAANPTSAPSTE
jgi:hypothetical protein